MHRVIIFQHRNMDTGASYIVEKPKAIDCSFCQFFVKKGNQKPSNIIHHTPRYPR